MKRGEVWTLQDKYYASKSRPVVVIQSDKYDVFESIILCLFTSFPKYDLLSCVPEGVEV